MNGKKLLITRPEHDPGTRYLSQWSKIIIDAAEKKGMNVIDLHQQTANRREFEGRVVKTDPVFIIFNGHGNENCVTGHDNEILIKNGENEELLKNKITYAVSCDSAKNLGASCADNKTTFIGYDKSFIFNFDRRYLNRPLEDQKAKRFLDASNQVPLSLLKGHTSKQSSDRSKMAFKKAIISLLTSTNLDKDALEDAKDLLWDMEHQVCLGQEDARI